MVLPVYSSPSLGIKREWDADFIGYTQQPVTRDRRAHEKVEASKKMHITCTLRSFVWLQVTKRAEEKFKIIGCDGSDKAAMLYRQAALVPNMPNPKRRCKLPLCTTLGPPSELQLHCIHRSDVYKVYIVVLECCTVDMPFCEGEVGLCHPTVNVIDSTCKWRTVEPNILYSFTHAGSSQSKSNKSGSRHRQPSRDNRSAMLVLH
jgi:hypothetical protein